MVKIKHFFREIYLAVMDIAHSDSKDNQKMRRGILMYLLGLMIMSGGISLILQQNKLNHQNTYADWDYTTTTGIKTIQKSIDHDEKITVVLHRTGCGACENAQKDITNQLIKARQEHPTERLVVMDLKKMNKRQLRQLSQLIPNIVTPNGIPTPLVANLKPEKDHMKFLQFSETDNSRDINRVFRSIK